DPGEFAGDGAIGRGDLVERVGNLSADSGPYARKADRKVSVAQSPQRVEQQLFLLGYDFGGTLGACSWGGLTSGGHSCSTDRDKGPLASTCRSTGGLVRPGRRPEYQDRTMDGAPFRKYETGY